MVPKPSVKTKKSDQGGQNTSTSTSTKEITKENCSKKANASVADGTNQDKKMTPQETCPLEGIKAYGFNQQMCSPATGIRSFANQQWPTHCSSISYPSTFVNSGSYPPPAITYDYFSDTQHSSTHFQKQNVNQPWSLPSNASFSYPTTSTFDESNNGTWSTTPFQASTNTLRRFEIKSQIADSSFIYQYIQQQPLPQQQSMNRGNYGNFE